MFSILNRNCLLILVILHSPLLLVFFGSSFEPSIAWSTCIHFKASSLSETQFCCCIASPCASLCIFTFILTFTDTHQQSVGSVSHQAPKTSIPLKGDTPLPLSRCCPSGSEWYCTKKTKREIKTHLDASSRALLPQLQSSTHPLSLCSWEIGGSQNIDLMDDFLQVWISEALHERIIEGSFRFLTPCLGESLLLQRCSNLKETLRSVWLFYAQWPKSLLVRKTHKMCKYP